MILLKDQYFNTFGLPVCSPISTWNLEFSYGGIPPVWEPLSKEKGLYCRHVCVFVNAVTLEDVENVSDPLQSVKPGLVSSADVCLPLKSVHVRAKLVDLAAQVC